jgi:hypothetical protein
MYPMRPRVAPHEKSGSCREENMGDDSKAPANDSRKGAPSRDALDGYYWKC